MNNFFDYLILHGLQSEFIDFVNRKIEKGVPLTKKPDEFYKKQTKLKVLNNRLNELKQTLKDTRHLYGDHSEEFKTVLEGIRRLEYEIQALEVKQR